MQSTNFETPSDVLPFEEGVEAIRSAAMMDRSALGKLAVTGKDRESLLHRLSTNEIRGMKPGESRINIFTNPKGRIVDVVEMLAEPDSYLLLTSSGNAQLLKDWLDKYCFIEDVKLEDQSEGYSIISLFGREADAKLKSSSAQKDSLPAAGSFVHGEIDGHPVIIHKPAALSVCAFNLIIEKQHHTAIWQALQRQFAAAGPDSYEYHRISKGVPAFGHEIVEKFNPHEVALFPFIDFDKGCYIGQEVIARLDTYDKVQRQLTGLRFRTELQPATGTDIYSDDNKIGTLTSFSPAPETGSYLGIAVIRKQYNNPGATVLLKQQDQTIEAELCSFPMAESSQE